MILNALYDYYNRRLLDESQSIPQFGFGTIKIHFVILLDKEGNLLNINDLRVIKQDKYFPKEIIGPEAVIRSSGINPNFLWDNSGYVLGFTKDKEENIILTQNKFEAFKELHNSIGKTTNDEGLKAAIKFLNSWDPANYESLKDYKEIASANLTFRLSGTQNYIFESEKIKQAWLQYRKNQASDFISTCLVLGKRRNISKLHNPIKGIKGTSASGGRLVSFNADAFISYNKTQSYNAPVSEEAMFAYTTALNKLLHRESRNNFLLGNTTVVFWTDKPSQMETIFGFLLNPIEDETLLNDLNIYFEALKAGKRPFEIEADTRFFILGLSPNRSRISVRFFFTDTVENIDRNLRKHFKDMEIIKSFENDPDIYHIGIRRILKEIAVQGKTENIPPLLEGALFKSIITGVSYPQNLLALIINRIRAEHKINYIRAATIKAYLNRKNRITNINMEVPMSLDKNISNIAYRLGRLFAVLEKVQQDAIGNANATITDRFYSTASSSPRTVFPQLIRLSQHHLSKVKSGSWYSQLIEEILEGVNEFPAFLNLENQGYFALGYYHQKRDLYTKKNKEVVENE